MTVPKANLQNDVPKAETGREKLDPDAFASTFVTDTQIDVICFNAKGKVVYVNRASCKRFGYSEEEFLALSVWDYDPNMTRDEWPQAWSDLCAIEYIHFDAVHIDSGKNELASEVYLQSIEYNGQQYALCHVLDASERKRTKQALETQNQLLESLVEERTDHLERALAQVKQTSKVKTQFLGNISHELRTPLNGIAGLSQLLKLTNDQAKRSDYIDKIESCTRDLTQIVENLLELSNRESSVLETSNDEFDLAAIFAELSDHFAPKAAAKKLTFTVSADAITCTKVIGDVSKIRKVLTDLVDNAIKFTAEGEVTVYASLSNLIKGTATLRVDVIDTGVGIEGDECSKVFLPFQQTDLSNTRAYGGLGLGLTLCKSSVEAMGGTIGVTSNPDAGSNFWFTVPLELIDEPNATITQQLPPNSKIIIFNIPNQLNYSLTNLLIAQGARVLEPRALESAKDLLLETQRQFHCLIFYATSKQEADEIADQLLAFNTAQPPELIALLENNIVDEVCNDQQRRYHYCAMGTTAEELVYQIKTVLRR